MPALSVRVAPYLADPYRDRFVTESRTEYSFVLSDAVPGMVYQLRAVVPGASPAREETLTLQGYEASADDKRGTR